MGVMDKLMFWKKEPDISGPDKDFPDLSKEFAGGFDSGKDTGFGMGKDSLGLGKDTTPGLGGTGDMSKGPYENDISMRGPGFEHVEEPAPLKSAPLEKKPIYYQEIGQAPGQYQQQPYQRDISRDIEVISAKLDSIKTMLDMLNHKIDAMERQQNKRGRMEW